MSNYRPIILSIPFPKHFTLSFIHSVFCLTTGPMPPPKRCLHIVRSRASSFKWAYPLLSLRSSSSFLRLLATSISPFIFRLITCFRRQFLRKMWPIQLAFRFLISCRIFLCSLTLSNTSSFLTWLVQLIFSILLQHHISKLYRYFWSAARSIQVSALSRYISSNLIPASMNILNTNPPYFDIHNASDLVSCQLIIQKLNNCGLSTGYISHFYSSWPTEYLTYVIVEHFLCHMKRYMVCHRDQFCDHSFSAFSLTTCVVWSGI